MSEKGFQEHYGALLVTTSLELGIGLLISAIALYTCDLMTVRFRENPSPERALTVRLLGVISVLANAGFYSAFIVLAIMCVVSFASFIAPPHDGNSLPRWVIAGSIFVGFSAAGFIRSLIRQFANSTSLGPIKVKSLVASPPNAGASLPYFVAMQYYALILNRTYKVFEANTMLCGALVNGLVASPATVSGDFADPDYWARTPSETLYDALDVTSRTFLKLNFVNFQIPWSDIARIDYMSRKKWGMGNVPHSGRIFIRLKSGKSRELILLGTQNGENLRQRLTSHLAKSVAVG